MKLLREIETHTLPGDVHVWCAKIFLVEFNLRAKLKVVRSPRRCDHVLEEEANDN